MLRPSICIEMIFPGEPFETRIDQVAQAGFGAIEFWSWKDKGPAVLAAAQKHGVVVSNFSGQRLGDLIDKDQHALVTEDFCSALDAWSRYRCPYLMVLAQQLGEAGKVVRPRQAEASQEEIHTIAAGLKQLLAELDRRRISDLKIVFEPLNVRLDHPGYAVATLETARRLYEAVGDNRFGILLDLYHQSMSGDDLPAELRRFASMISYVHAADVPGRHEPGTGKIDWKRVFETLLEIDYDGYVGFEFSPAQGSEHALERIRGLWETLVGAL
jgi:hydroxypyruvate isomerase